MSDGLVLAGGGTKGAFEVGVVEHLVREVGIRPEVIASTSAGSILGVVLAQARGAEELPAALEDLRADLLAMTRTDQVFGRQPWLEELHGTPLGRSVDDFVTVRTRPPLPEDPDATPGASPARSTPDRHHHRWTHLLGAIRDLPALARARGELRGHLGSLLTLDPLEAALRGHGSSAMRPVDTTRVQRPGVALRMAVTALGAAETHYVANDGTVLGPDAVTPLGDRRASDALEGAMASSSVPMIFPPRRIGEEAYVDGGCLENIPVAAAVANGATRIHAVLAVPLTPPRSDADFMAMDLVGIHLRCATEIGFHWTQVRNLAVALPEGSTLCVIAPTVDVVGPFEVRQELMLIDMDYGWMRAQEATAGLDPPALAEAMDATDAVVVARENAWYLEQEAADPGDAEVPLPSDRAAALARCRSRVTEALQRRRRHGLVDPPGAERWSRDREHDDPDPGQPS